MKPTDFCEVDPRFMSMEKALLLPDEGKRLFFDRARIRHPRINEVLADFESMAALNTGTDLILLTGPTGVGKSTLITRIWEMIMEKYQQKINEDPGYIPAVIISAPASGEAVFSWRMFYTRIGDALAEPLIDRKQSTFLVGDRVITSRSSRGCTVAALQTAISGCLLARRTSLLVIDEAIPLVRNARGDSLETHMDALRSLSNICGLTLAIVGSYDLLRLVELSGQLARRSTILHFPRYQTGVKADENAFQSALASLQRYIPLKNVPDLTLRSDQLHNACIGCVGILKDTLARALEISLHLGGRWSDENLRKALLPKKSLLSILRETLEGEKQIKDLAFGSATFNDYADIQNFLQEERTCNR